MTYYFFAIISLGTASFGNEYLFTQKKDNCPLIKNLGTMYIDFYEYRPCSGRISEFFEKMLMKIFSVFMVMHILQENRKCAHGLMRKVGGL